MKLELDVGGWKLEVLKAGSLQQILMGRLYCRLGEFLKGMNFPLSRNLQPRTSNFQLPTLGS